MVDRACLIPWSSAEKMLDPGVRRQEPEVSGAGIKKAHEVTVGFSVTDPHGEPFCHGGRSLLSWSVVPAGALNKAVVDGLIFSHFSLRHG
jgi:hypothetical protein